MNGKRRGHSMKQKNVSLLSCSDPPDATFMDFNKLGVNGNIFHQWQLSRRNKASYITQWVKNSKKSGRNFISKKLFYNWCRRLRKLPKRPNRPLMQTHAQCFQIWQVSARYCTFLDFLAHCCGKTDSECQTFLEQTLIVQPAEEFSGETAAQVD